MKINIYDADLNRIADIGEGYISCLWAEGYNTAESFVLELASNPEYKKKIKPDCYVGRTDRRTLMVIKTVQVKGGKLIASGRQASIVMGDVAMVERIPSGSSIDTAVRNAYNNSSGYRNLEIAESNLGVTYPQEIENTDFFSVVSTMCQSEDVGFRAVRSSGKIEVQFYQPAEDPTLVFSEAFGNVTIDSVTMSTNSFKNYAIVLADGVRVDVDQTNGADRREIIVNAIGVSMADGETEEDYEKRLYAVGAEALLAQRKVFYCAFSPYAKDFGSRYDLGDILTVYMPEYGTSVRARVAKFTQKAQNNKTTTSIEVGDITLLR